MARPGGTSVRPGDTMPPQFFMKVLLYIATWIDKHMDRNCVGDATESEQGRPALHFKSTEVIEGFHFCFELEKEPVGNMLDFKEFNDTWLPHLDAEIYELGEHFSNVMNVREGSPVIRNPSAS